MSKNICVYCSSSQEIDGVYFEQAKELGRIMAMKKYSLIYGGGNSGLMGQVAQSVKDFGGNVKGVIPQKLKDFGMDFKQADVMVVTKDMRERKEKMERFADAFITLSGGFGTLEEIAEIITLKQLGYHTKPIVLLNTNGFYDKLLEFFETVYAQNFARQENRNIYFVANSIEEAIDYIETYTANTYVSKWFVPNSHQDVVNS